ncbi:hypothetical protein [Paenibacillus chitinolyticus]|uniref:hypothetical protein n=1 Tax=Paenibacillus chitinolyticus TaxID=79263 RepID=UPI00366D2DA3
MKKTYATQVLPYSSRPVSSVFTAYTPNTPTTRTSRLSYLGPEVYEEFMEHYSPCRERARETAVLLDKTFGCYALPLKVQ